MIRLRGHHDALASEHVFRPIHALIRGETRMIAEDVLAGHALRDGVLLHRLHLVVGGGAVIAAHR